MAKPVVVAIDFDGTIVEHEFPRIGQPAPDAFHWMKVWQEAGARLILWTMRDDDRTPNGAPENGKILSEAVEYCRSRGIEFWGVNRNPEQDGWSKSPKAYANIYVDDMAFGCPVVKDARGRDVVDWSVVGPAVLKLIKAAKK